MAGGKKSEPIVVAQIMGKWVGGGVEAVIMNYYRHIDRTKVQFDFICDEDSTNIPYEEIEKLGGHVILCPPYQKLFKYMKFLENLFREKKYRIVHSNINTLSVFPLRAAKKAGVKVRIAHSHSTSNPKEWKKNLMKNVLRLFSKKYATDYFACSELAGRFLFGDKTFESGKVKIIRNAIDVEKFKFDPEARKKLRKEIGIADDDFVIGHIGRFVEQKNHRFLIDVFAEVRKKKKNAKLVLVGQGPLMNEMKEKVRELGLEKDVFFLAQRNDSNKLYSLFDVFCLPSLYEGLGVVLLEAQASTLNCVASNKVPSEAKLNEDVYFLKINRGDINKWASKVLSFNNRSSRAIISNNKLKEKYEIKNESINTEEWYLEKSKIKICHIVSGLKSGGVESMIYNYCSRMDGNKYIFSILYQHEPSSKNLCEFRKIGFELVRIPDKRKNPLKNYRVTKRYLKINKIDIVHCHMTLMNVVPLMAAWRVGVKKRISHSHATDIEGGNWLVALIQGLLKKTCRKLATDLFACGEEAGKYLYKNDFMIINNALPISKYQYNYEARNKNRNKYGIKEGDRAILHIGRFEPQKNHQFLLESIKDILKHDDRYKLLLVGSGPLESEIKRYVKNEGIPNVIFTGVLPDVNELYSACDLFVLPSKFEGLPVSALEAQVSGLRCILSSNIDRKVVVLRDNVKLLGNNIADWKKEYIDDDNYARNIDIEAFNKRQLNIDVEYQKLENIYASVGRGQQ